jgi:hypothetical protein
LLLNQLTYQYEIQGEPINFIDILLKIHCDVTNSIQSSHPGYITKAVLQPWAFKGMGKVNKPVLV